jgi:hypothetical protein
MLANDAVQVDLEEALSQRMSDSNAARKRILYRRKSDGNA